MSVQSPDQPNVRQHLFVPDGGDYDIPYRCLVPERVDGLLIAGRCLSASREAIGSARMGAQCMAYGHAAGVAAALSIGEHVAPRALPAEQLRGELRAQGAQRHRVHIGPIFVNGADLGHVFYVTAQNARCGYQRFDIHLVRRVLVCGPAGDVVVLSFASGLGLGDARLFFDPYV